MTAFAQSPGSQPPPQRDGQRPPMSQGERPTKQKKSKKDPGKIATEKIERLYIYGVAISTADSTVYMTDELMLDNVSREKKTKFLTSRSELSRQFQQHLAQQGIGSVITSVSYSEKLKTCDRRFTKQHAAFMKKGFIVKTVDQSEFRFTPVVEE